MRFIAIPVLLVVGVAVYLVFAHRANRAPTQIGPGGLVGREAAHLSARMDAVGAEGISEVVYCPAGADIERELEAFAAAAR